MMASEEGRTLLPNVPAPPTDERLRARRSQKLRIAVGVVSALALVAGSVVAVNMVADHQQHAVGTASMSATAPSADMEAQFGWGTWCSARAAVSCLFSSDRDKCKEGIMATCDPEEEDHDHDGDGSGSGSGSGSGPHYSGPDVGDAEHSNRTHHKKHHKKHRKPTPAPVGEPRTVPEPQHAAAEEPQTTAPPEPQTTTASEPEPTSAAEREPAEPEPTAAADAETTTAPPV